MAWSSSAPSFPSGSSWNAPTSGQPSKLTGNYFSLTYEVHVARRDTNQVCIRFRATLGYGQYGSAQFYPPSYIYFRVGSTDYTAPASPSKNGDTLTRYWTGTLNAGSTVTVYCGYSSDGSTGTALRSATMAGPAYLTTYTITYNANGGAGAPASQTKTYGTTLTLSSTVPTRDGYNFVGWATSSTATSAEYQAGGSYTANASSALYAVWSIIQYIITYKANGGVGADQTQTKNYGTPVTLQGADTFTRSNYTFQNWNTASDGSGTTYAAGASYGTNASVTLYAIWKKNNIPVYVNDNGTIRQVEKAYINVNGTIKECTVYINVNDNIYIIQ